MKKVCFVFFATCFAYLFTVNANAETDLKLAVVDMQAVLQYAPQIRKIKESLTQKFKSSQLELEKMAQKLKNETDQLKKDGAILKAADRITLENNIIADNKSEQQMLASFRKRLSEEESKSLSEFYKQLLAVVSKLATESHVDLVLQKGSTLYAKNDLDLTKKVIDILSRK